VPLARGDGAFEQAGARVAIIAFVALVAAVVLGWSPLVPVAVALVGGTYAVELVIDDAPLDVSVPVIALGLLFAAELAYWSLDERCRAPGEGSQGLRRAALVALGGVVGLVVATALLVLVDEVRTRSLALDLVGALAAAAVLAMVLVAARTQSRARA
jgi:hypothetical protein